MKKVLKMKGEWITIEGLSDADQKRLDPDGGSMVRLQLTEGGLMGHICPKVFYDGCKELRDKLTLVKDQHYQWMKPAEVARIPLTIGESSIHCPSLNTFLKTSFAVAGPKPLHKKIVAYLTSSVRRYEYNSVGTYHQPAWTSLCIGTFKGYGGNYSCTYGIAGPLTIRGKVYDLTKGGVKECISPSREAIAIRDDNGNVFAEIERHVLWLLHDTPTVMCPEIEQYFLEVVRPLLDGTNDPDFWVEQRRAAVATYKEDMAKLVARRVKESEANLAAEIERSKKAVEDAQRTITQHMTKLVTDEAQMDGLKAVNKERIRADFSLLDKTTEIDYIYLEWDSLYVHTKDVFCEGVWLGPLDIAINMRNNSVDVKQNEFPTLDGGYQMFHPHLGNNFVCWSSAITVLSNLLATAQYPQAILFILAFLHTYHHESGYKVLLDKIKARNEKLVADGVVTRERITEPVVGRTDIAVAPVKRRRRKVTVPDVGKATGEDRPAGVPEDDGVRTGG